MAVKIVRSVHMGTDSHNLWILKAVWSLLKSWSPDKKCRKQLNYK